MQEKVASINKNYKKMTDWIRQAQEEKEEEKKTEDKNAKRGQDETTDDDDKKDKMATLKAKLAKAMDEEDPEKRKDAANRAMDEMEKEEEKESRKAKKGQDEEKKEKQNEAKIASFEHEFKKPIVEKILTAAKILNPKGIKVIEEKLKTASLESVKDLYENHYKQFNAAMGLEDDSSSVRSNGFIPFQLNAALESDEEDELFVAAKHGDYSKLDTEKLYAKLQEPYQ